MKYAVLNISLYLLFRYVTDILMVLSVPYPNQFKLKCSKHGFSLILFGSIRQSAMIFVKDLTLFHPDFATIGRCELDVKIKWGGTNQT